MQVYDPNRWIQPGSWGPQPSNPWSSASTATSSVSDYLKRLRDSFRSGTANTLQSAANSIMPSSNSTTSTFPTTSTGGPPPPYSAIPVSGQQSIAPTNTTTTTSTNGPPKTENEGFKYGKIVEPDGKTKWELNIDAQKAGINNMKIGETVTTVCTDNSGQPAFTVAISKNESGVTTYDVSRGGVTPSAQSGFTNGPTQSALPTSGTNITGTGPSPLIPRKERMPSFVDFLREDGPQYNLYGQLSGDWSKYPEDTVESSSIGYDQNTRQSINYADWLWKNGGKNETAFNDTRKELENTTNFFQNRYHDTDWNYNRMTGEGKNTLLNRKQARNIARQFLEESSNDPWSSDINWQLSKFNQIDQVVANTTLSNQSITISHSNLPTNENGLGSASSLSYDGSDLGEWIKKQVGEPLIRDPSRFGPDGRPAPLGYSEDQVQFMKDTFNRVQTYGEEICSEAGCDAEDTSNLSSQIGSLLVEDMYQNNMEKPNNEQKDYALRYLLKYGKVMKSLPKELQETYRSLSTGRISLDDLSSLPNTTTTDSNNGSVPTNSTTNDELRNGFNNWLDSRQQQPTSTNDSYGIPSTMQTGHGINPNGQGIGTDKRSAMKGSRNKSVSFNPQVGAVSVPRDQIGRKDVYNQQPGDMGQSDWGSPVIN
ncbi:uncharacterized protein I206_103344 [Kwoniella pini CBS 10737]|uniref:Uncharacterized protein n=1 Tax=Kwoniella pini CBS 10737 TaxID=1296096 RepID=A0A1B9IAC0_9TREE|nr:uncharacterized protein I206_01650 [Kwoniella pini CBS 10737]OCF52361.1 hypothetical protein I206_01650 [Kwoniella pini CBS 10737]